MTEKNKTNWTVVINAILTAISTIVGALFLGSCTGVL